MAPRKLGGGRRTCAGGRAGAGRTSQAVPSVSPGGGELQQVPILYTEQRTRPSALSELRIPALHTALFLFLLARRAGTLEQVWTPARCEQGPGKSQAHLGRRWTFELDRGAFCLALGLQDALWSPKLWSRTPAPSRPSAHSPQGRPPGRFGKDKVERRLKERTPKTSSLGMDFRLS